MINARTLLLRPSYTSKGLAIYPPSVSQVLDTKNFNGYIGILLQSQEDIDDIFEKEEKNKGKPVPSPWQYMMGLAQGSVQIRALINEGLEFFLHQQCFVLPTKNLILIGDVQAILDNQDYDAAVIVKEEDYFELQNAMRTAIGIKEVEPPNPDEHPKIRAMKAKARLRDRIKAKQAKGTNLATSLIALCCMNIGITPLNVGEIGYASVSAYMSMYQQKEKYETDIASLQAGADAKKVKPKYWITNIDD